MTTLEQDFKEKICNLLTELSCCHRCIIRFLGVHVLDNEKAYQNPKEYLKELVHNTENYTEPEPKRIKANVCPVCLNCYNSETLEKILESYNLVSKEYKAYNTFFFNVSFPKCLSIRAHSMYLYLVEKFPNTPIGNLYNSTDTMLEQPHRIFRSVASNILSKTLNKTFHPKSNLSLLITLAYKDDNTEVEAITSILGKKKRNKFEVSRNNIFELLKDIDEEKFKKYFPVPPVIPQEEISIEKIDLCADPIYLGGRYFKFKRNVGQTPWVIDGVSVSEHNVQDIIFDAICDTLGFDKKQMTFSASGREDLDVRMLGTGRPFYIKIENPANRNILKSQLLAIEESILKTELAAVVKLKIVYASDLNKIKTGEELKKKTYKALCKTDAPDIKEAVEKINALKELEITQATPMRVLHRRSLLPRTKTIHKMEAKEAQGHKNLFEVEIVTQAGTYVKEFVHGDLERTCPNLCSIVGYSTDIVALDCIDINLEWP